MATSISLEEWEKLFVAHDKDKSGTLDIFELRNLLRSNNSNMSDAQIADMFVFMTGPKVTTERKITKDEFLNGIRRIKDFVEKATALFKRFDSDNNGFLSPPELRKLLFECDPNLKEEVIVEIIKCADCNGDGHVSLPEFLKALS